MNLIAKYVIPGSHRIKILDIGSGTGTFLSQLSDNVYEKWGVEIEKKLTRLYKKLGIRGINQDFLTYNFKKQKFDCITMWHVIEHIHDPQKLIKKINSLLAKGIIKYSSL
jgi:2-polyprenyl-3-methyl-5-hydroxy-6-metoxy-1,4-benzoquinol methylase